MTSSLTKARTLAGTILLAAGAWLAGSGATEPASLLAVFVADDGAQLTTFGK